MELNTLTVDLSAIAHNARQLLAAAEGAQVMAVVKADAYNHGVEQVVPVLDRAGVAAFGVATLAEAAQVRPLTDKPVLAWIWHESQPIPAGVDVAISTFGQLTALLADATPRTVAVAVDTGLNRSGFDEADWPEVFRQLASTHAQHLQLSGLCTHLAVADDPANPFTSEQSDTFQRALTVARGAGLTPRFNHVANSPGLLTRANLGVEVVRPGLALYGQQSVSGHAPAAPTLRPAMTWSAGVTTVKKIGAGEGASYGLTWRAETERYTAVVAAGYADGVPRALQGHLEVTINGVRYRQVGRVCMDQIIIDLGEDEPTVASGDEAILFGPGGHGEMTADDWAAALGTINYEVICMPRGRTVRTYVS
ncbi:MAG: alanine racemase [Corynebacterium sp.]|nr:alanine racemase [Corynebacterium sp.]